MYVISRKRINIIIMCLLLGIFTYSYESEEMNFEESIEITSIPSSGKVVILDARTRSTR